MYQRSIATAAAILAISAGINTVQAGNPIALQPSVQAGELDSPPNRLTVSLFESKESRDPVAIQTYFPGEWTTDVDLSGGLPQSDTAIRFSMQFDQIDQRKSGEALWVETRMDGRRVGERVSLAAIQPPRFTIEGEMETRGLTGGIRFPDNSFQDSASPLVTGDGATTALNMNNHGITNLPAPANASDAVPLSYLESYLASKLAITWQEGSGCDLGSAEGSTCTTTAICPAGQTAVSGGCHGFTSVAIGRSWRSNSSTWQCFYRRISTISTSNLLKAQVACR